MNGRRSSLNVLITLRCFVVVRRSEERSCEISKKQRLLSVLSIRRTSSRPDSVLRSSASASRLYTKPENHDAEKRPRHSVDYLNVFSPNVRLTISNPNISVSQTAAKVRTGLQQCLPCCT